MLIKNARKMIFLLCLIAPVSVFAESDPLWNKLSSMAASGWMEVDSLTQSEMDQLTTLSKSGDSNAQYALGMIYQVKHQHEKAGQWLKLAAEQGHVPARYSYNKNTAGHTGMATLSW